MELLVLVWRQYRWPFISVMALSLASAALGIGLIAFINQRLIETADTSLLVLPEFLGLLLLLMAVTLGSQLALTTLGHHFVYRLRSEFIKRILDTHVERIEQLGSASLLAGLTSDVRNITIAFVRLPELVQGIILTIGSAAYLWMLSGKMLLVTAIWMAVTIIMAIAGRTCSFPISQLQPPLRLRARCLAGGSSGRLPACELSDPSALPEPSR